MFVVDRAVLQGRSQSQIAISDTAEQTVPLANGVYDIWSDIECFIAIGPNAAAGLTVNSGHILYADNVFAVQVYDGDVVGAICPTGMSGTLRLHQVN